METLIIGNSLEELKSIPSESVDAVITDPPYGISFASHDWDTPSRMLPLNTEVTYKSSAHKKALQFQLWCEQWVTEVERILKPGGMFVTFGASRTIARMGSAINNSNLTFMQQSIWLYATGMAKGTNAARYVEAQTIYGDVTNVSLKKLETESIKQGNPGYKPSTKLGEKWDGWAIGLKPSHEPILFAVKGEYSGADIPFVFSHNKPPTTERVFVDGVAHPTVKPLGLMKEIIETVTSSGDVVLDPFLGSGTTMEACMLSGRSSIGIEMTKEYIPLIRMRLERSKRNGE